MSRLFFRMLKTHELQSVLAVTSGCGVLISLAMIFLVVPTETVMGAVQRVFYFHVGAAIAAYALLALLLCCSSLYLLSRLLDWDELADSAAAVAFLLCTIVLLSGMIWGHSAWNTWWRWEPRLVSFLVLWLMLGSYRILRWYAEGHERQRTFASVMGILCALNVPIVIFSIRLLAETEQLHPQVVARGGLRDLPYATFSLGLAAVAFLILAGWLFVLNYHQRNLGRRLLAIERTKGVYAA